jgi:hypothetical protein
MLVSHDENSMPAHFREFLQSGNESPGLLLVPQGSATGLVIESILLIWVASEAHECVKQTYLASLVGRHQLPATIRLSVPNPAMN